jgi:hypothetical protein
LDRGRNDGCVIVTAHRLIAYILGTFYPDIVHDETICNKKVQNQQENA